MGTLLPTETRRSETSQALQQFSTPVELAFVAALAARLSADDLVLEPSAGTGMLAIQAEISGAKLLLNEWAEDRHALLKGLFPKRLSPGSMAHRFTIDSIPRCARALS